MERDEQLDLLADHVVGILSENCREAIRQAVSDASVMRICGAKYPYSEELLDDVLGHIAKRWEKLRDMERRLKASAVFVDEEELD